MVKLKLHWETHMFIIHNCKTISCSIIKTPEIDTNYKFHKVRGVFNITAYCIHSSIKTFDYNWVNSDKTLSFSIENKIPETSIIKI